MRRRIAKWKNKADELQLTGNVYYLDTTSGNNSNTGLSSSSAFATREYAESIMDNGDVLSGISGEGEYPRPSRSEFVSYKLNDTVYNQYVINVTCSRTSGVAPLSVHFDAIPAEMDVFFDMEFQWNFDDSGAGNWHDGKSKNSAKGPIACHVYETSGSYTAILTVKENGVTRYTESFEITVTNADTYYAGTATTCVNPSGDSDFTNAPSGCRQVSTDDLSEITQYATAGSRILFKRGCSWTVSSDLTWPTNTGPVTIGAYGTGTNPDALGIYDNNPYITLTGSGTDFLKMDTKQDWRIMDLEFYNYDAEDTTDSYFGRRAYAISGTYDYAKILFLRLKAYGTNSFSLAHYGTADYVKIDQIVFASCHIENTYMENIYVGAERLALLGNNCPDNARSHVMRVWQGYKSVIQHNYNSGSSVDIPVWQQSALKFHGPKEEYVGEVTPGSQNLESRTDYAVISDNVFGGCGPWPVGIGPQNTVSDERLTYIIIERNYFAADYGSLHSTLVTIGMHIWAKYVAMRNNILDGTGGGTSYRAISLSDRGVVPHQDYVYIYNNTVFRGDVGTSDHYGIDIWSDATNTIARNNLVSFPYATGTHAAIYDDSADLISSNNIFEDDPDFIDPENATPLSRDFSVDSDSEAVNAGYSVPVYEDFDENVRPNGSYDVGAYEYYS